MNRDQLADELEGLLEDGLGTCASGWHALMAFIERHTVLAFFVGLAGIIVFVPIGAIARLVRR